MAEATGTARRAQAPRLHLAALRQSGPGRRIRLPVRSPSPDTKVQILSVAELQAQAADAQLCCFLVFVSLFTRMSCQNAVMIMKIQCVEICGFSPKVTLGGKCVTANARVRTEETSKTSPI